MEAVLKKIPICSQDINFNNLKTQDDVKVQCPGSSDLWQCVCRLLENWAPTIDNTCNLQQLTSREIST